MTKTQKIIQYSDLESNGFVEAIFLIFQCGVQNFRRRDQCFKCAGPKTDIDASGEGADEVSPHPTNSKFKFLKYFPQTVIKESFQSFFLL